VSAKPTPTERRSKAPPKMNGKWVIINVLWETKPKKEEKKH
jgi:hypothetical protein